MRSIMVCRSDMCLHYFNKGMLITKKDYEYRQARRKKNRQQKQSRRRNRK